MHHLALLLLILGANEGSAVQGNPARPFTDEEQIMWTISVLEDALIDKDELMVAACLSDKVSSREVKDEVQNVFSSYVVGVRASSGMPLVYLRVIDIKIDEDKAKAKVEAFTYGSDKRIKAVHSISFRRGDGEWLIDDVKPLSALLKQIGGIIPIQQPDASEKKRGA